MSTINNQETTLGALMQTTEQILSPFSPGHLDYLMVTPALGLYPDPANSRHRSPSLAVGYVLGQVKKAGYTVKFIDMDACLISPERLYDYIESNRPRLIGFTTVTTTINMAAILAKEIKKRCPEIPICVGGPHATMVPEETLTEFGMFDFLVRGEGEVAIPTVLQYLGEGREDYSEIQGVITQGKKDLSSCLVADLESLPFPAWEEFDLTRYPGVDQHRTRRELPIITARGCPYDCCFCCRQPGMRKVRYRSVDSVLNEIARNVEEFGAETMVFADETFTIKKDFAVAICEGILARGLHRMMRWSCSTRVDAADQELFDLMRRAGCYDMFFGFESGDDRLLEIAGKRITIAQMRSAVQMAKQTDIAVHGCFILGLPGETEDTIEKSWKLAKELDIRGVSFPIAVPFPGTRLRAMAERSEYGLRILSNNWDDYGKQYPGVMDQGELTMEKLLYYQQKSYLNHPLKWDYLWPEDELDRTKRRTQSPLRIEERTSQGHVDRHSKATV
ncbi:B12-binding domain-containing radical SAM protein [Planctomycetota bacterium]